MRGVEIGADSVVATGAVVTSDLPAGKIYLGIPAKEFKDVPKDQMLDQQGWEE